MAVILFLLSIFAFLGTIVYLMALGMDYMQNNHPDYKGNDMFGDEEDDENSLK
jgi:hypothetical protein